MSLIECRRVLSGASAIHALATAGGRLGGWLQPAPYEQQLGAQRITGRGVSDPCRRECIAYQPRLLPLP